MSHALAQLQKLTEVVADTGDIEAIKSFAPQDATTNPSLVLKAATLAPYQAYLEEAKSIAETDIDRACDTLACHIGKEVLQCIPGFISTEVDARLSFDTQATVTRAKQILNIYESLGVDKTRVLIKIAATWQGIQAAKQLEAEGIKCNITLLFCMEQAIAAANANAFLISPFIGRITDWYKAKEDVEHYSASDDPGVQSVKSIYEYYKGADIETVVMGASFRNTEQILGLAGCDKLTISPALLAELESMTDEVHPMLNAAQEQRSQTLSESQFQLGLALNPMAVEKLNEGIRAFAADQEKLADLLCHKVA